MTYKYNSKNFNADQDWVIRKACIDKINTKWLDFITRTNPDGTPIYDHNQMERILDGFEEGLSEKKINIYAATTKINGVEKAIFDSNQMLVICQDIVEKVDKSKISILTRLNSDDTPVYSYNQMRQISFMFDFKKEWVEYVAKLNENGEPVFDEHQMEEVRIGVTDGLSKEEIDIYARLTDNEPIFSSKEMYSLRSFIKDCFNSDQIQQIKECVDEGLSYKEIDPFIQFDVPAEKIRILRGFYQLDCFENEIAKILESEPSYEELKEIKYLLQCAKRLNVWPDEILNSEVINFNTIKDNLTASIIHYYSFPHVDEGESLINRLLSYKMPPEQIDFIIDTDKMFFVEQMKPIAIGFLNGLTIEEMNKITQRYDISGDFTKEEIRKTVKSMTEDIEDAVRVKFYNLSGIESEIKIGTDWLDEIER